MEKSGKRLGYFLDNQGKTAYWLERELNLANGRISKAIERNSELKKDIVDLIVSYFKNLSRKWLEEGEGEMIKNELEVKESLIGYAKNKSLNKIYQPENAYYVPTPAIAGFLNGMADPTFYEQLQTVQLPPEYQTINWVFEVDGDSMYPTFSNGDHIGCRKIIDSKIIRFGEPYIIDCGEGGLMLKRIYPVKDDNGKIVTEILILRSDNNGYPDMEISKIDIKHLFLVTTRISKNVGHKRSYEDQVLKMAKDIDILIKTIGKQKSI